MRKTLEDTGRVPMSAEEQETIIRFDKTGNPASVFTYEYKWKKHLEQNLGLKPIMNNGQGGREYELDKKQIPLPRVVRVVSEKQKERMSKMGKEYGKEQMQKLAKLRKQGMGGRQSAFI